MYKYIYLKFYKYLCVFQNGGKKKEKEYNSASVGISL